MELFNVSMMLHGCSNWGPFLKCIRLLMCITSPLIYLSSCASRVSVVKPKNKPLQFFIKNIVAVN